MAAKKKCSLEVVVRRENGVETLVPKLVIQERMTLWAGAPVSEVKDAVAAAKKEAEALGMVIDGMKQVREEDE